MKTRKLTDIDRDRIRTALSRAIYGNIDHHFTMIEAHARGDDVSVTVEEGVDFTARVMMRLACELGTSNFEITPRAIQTGYCDTCAGTADGFDLTIRPENDPNFFASIKTHLQVEG